MKIRAPYRTCIVLFFLYCVFRPPAIGASAPPAEPTGSVANNEETLPFGEAYVYTRADLQYLGISNLKEFFRIVPGLEVYTSRASQSMLGMHGIGRELSKNILILIDGIPYEWHFYGGIPLEVLPVAIDEIERIEILERPQSASIGAGPLQGMIRITTTSASQANVGRMKVAYGPKLGQKLPNDFALSFLETGKISLFHYKLLFELEGSRLFEASREQFSYPGVDYSPIYSRLQAFEKLQIEYRLHSRHFFTFMLSVKGGDIELADNSYLVTNERDVNNPNLIITETVSAVLATSRFHYRNQGAILPRLELDWDIQLVGGEINKASCYSVPQLTITYYDLFSSLQLNYHLTPSQRLLGGLDYRGSHVQWCLFRQAIPLTGDSAGMPANINDNWRDIDNIGLFLGHEMEFFDHAGSKSQARFDYHSVTQAQLSFLQAFFYQLETGLSRHEWHIAGASGFRNPSFLQLYNAPYVNYADYYYECLDCYRGSIQENTVAVGNVDLKTEKNVQLDVGYDLIYSKILSAGLSFFSIFSSDLITPIEADATIYNEAGISANTQQIFANSGTSRVAGGQIRLESVFSRQYSFFFNALLAREFAGAAASEMVSILAENSLSYGLRWDVPLQSWGNIIGSLNGSTLYRVYDDGQIFQPLDPTETSTEASQNQAPSTPPLFLSSSTMLNLYLAWRKHSPAQPQRYYELGSAVSNLLDSASRETPFGHQNERRLVVNLKFVY
jgi:outer membrane receptor for ferrienterochelin and colicin